MNHLIIYAHVNNLSFTHAITDVIVETSMNNGHRVKIRDLNAMNFNPVLSAEDIVSIDRGVVPDDVKEEHELIKWADVISFVYPLWWAGMPAIMKGYLDRVFSYGFAYTIEADGTPRGLLNGKKAMLFVPMGNPVELYKTQGVMEPLRKVSDIIIFDYVGITDVKQFYFGNVPGVNDETRKLMLAEVKDIIGSLE